MNLTGSPDYGSAGARIIYESDGDDGCSGNQYKQFDTSMVAGPTYNSVGLESGRNHLIGCPTTGRTSPSRAISASAARRQLQLRVDAYNAFNQAAITGRGTDSPTTTTRPDQNESPIDSSSPEGTLDPNRLQPRNAGFGAANAWSTNLINGNYQRVIQFTARMQF